MEERSNTLASIAAPVLAGNREEDWMEEDGMEEDGMEEDGMEEEEEGGNQGL